MDGKAQVLFVRTGGLEIARYGVKGTVECKLIEPIGIEYCTAYLRANGVSARIYDLTLELQEKSVRQILALDSGIIGFSILYSHMMQDSYRLITNLRKEGYKGHIIVGGTYPTLNAREVLTKFPLIDSVCMVEGEITTLDLYRALAEDGKLDKVRGLTYQDSKLGIIQCEPRQLVPRLDELPSPARDRFSEYQRMGGIVQIHSSRGCHANCSFCGTAAFYRCAPGRKWRARSPKHSVDELKAILAQSISDEVWFTDDNFIGPGSIGNERALTIAEEILARGLRVKLVIQSRADNLRLETLRALKRAGLRKIYIGVESGTHRHLATYNKWIDPSQNWTALKMIEAEGIYAELGFIGFDPYTTLDEFGVNVDFIRRICADSRFIHPFAFDMLIPYRGTPIARKLLDDGLAIEDGLDYQSVINDPVIAKAWRCVDHLLIYQGPATEHIKALIINDQTQSEAQEAIRHKNHVMAEGLSLIWSTLTRNPDTDEVEIKASLTELVDDLNRQLGINGLKANIA